MLEYFKMPSALEVKRTMFRVKLIELALGQTALGPDDDQFHEIILREIAEQVEEGDDYRDLPVFEEEIIIQLRRAMPTLGTNPPSRLWKALGALPVHPTILPELPWQRCADASYKDLRRVFGRQALGQALLRTKLVKTMTHGSSFNFLSPTIAVAAYYRGDIYADLDRDVHNLLQGHDLPEVSAGMLAHDYTRSTDDTYTHFWESLNFDLGKADRYSGLNDSW